MVFQSDRQAKSSWGSEGSLRRLPTGGGVPVSAEGQGPLQEFAATVQHVEHRALFWLSVQFIKRKAAYAFMDGVRNGEIKQHVLMGDSGFLNEALNQELTLEAAKVAAGHQ